MKKARLLFILFVIEVSHHLAADTNTFPLNGNAGIGVTSPSQALVIAPASSNAWEVLQRPDLSHIAVLQFLTNTNSDADWALGEFNDGTSDFHFHNQHTGHFVMTIGRENDNVGVGTAIPGSPLHVFGGGNLKLGTVRLDSDNPFTSITSRQNDSTSEPEGFLTLVNSYDATTNNIRIGGGLDEFNAATNLYFYTAPNVSTRAGTIRMSIDSSGNVGIGTTSATQKLAVTDTLAITNIAGAQTILLGNQNSTGANHPVLIRSGGGVLDLGSGTSWDGQGGNLTSLMHLDTFTGNIGIGTSAPQSTLAVNGTITTKEVVVTTTGWADYVFAENYNLAPLSEVEQQIKTEKHLPGIPSASDVAKNGISLGDMQAKMLAKIEEITLRQIEEEKQLHQQALRISELQGENRRLSGKVQ